MVRPAERIDHFASRVIDPLGSPKPGRAMLFSALTSLFSAFTIPVFCATWRLFRKPAGKNVTHEKIKNLFHINVSKKQKTSVEDPDRTVTLSDIPKDEKQTETLNVDQFKDPIAKQLKSMGYDSLPLYKITEKEFFPDLEEPIAVIEETKDDGSTILILAFNLVKNKQIENQPDQVTSETVYLNEDGFTKTNSSAFFKNDDSDANALVNSIFNQEVHQATPTTHYYLKDFENPQINRYDFAKVSEPDESFEIPDSIKIEDLDLPEEVTQALLAEAYEELPVYKDAFDKISYNTLVHPISVICQEKMGHLEFGLVFKVKHEKVHFRTAVYLLHQKAPIDENNPRVWQLSFLEGGLNPKPGGKDLPLVNALIQKNGWPSPIGKWELAS